MVFLLHETSFIIDSVTPTGEPGLLEYKVKIALSQRGKKTSKKFKKIYENMISSS